MRNYFKLVFLFIAFVLSAGLIYSTCLPVKATTVDDLELVGISVSPTPPPFNYDVLIKVGVKNNGEDPLTSLAGISSYTYTFDNFVVSEFTLPAISSSEPLEAGATVYYEITGKFNKIGYARLYFVVNSGSVLAERTQSNNYKSVNTTVVGAHDLSAGAPVVSPAYPAEDQECTITITIGNGGKFDLSSGIGVSSYTYQFSDFKEKSKSVPSITLANKLEVGGSVDFVFTGSFTSPGAKELYFKVDNGDFLEESNETNNESTKSLTIGAADAVDVAVNSIKFSKNKDELIKDDIVTITVSIVNLSDYSLISAIGFYERNYGWSSGGDYELTIPGIEITAVAHSDYPTEDIPLNPNGNFTYTFTGKVKDPGGGTAEFKIDIHNELAETDETNNSIAETYIIHESLEALYDFTITGVKVDFYSANRARVSWHTDEHVSDGYIMYKKRGYMAYDRFLLDLDIDSWPSSANKTEHTVDLPGISGGEEYIYIIKAENTYVNKEYEAKTFIVPDTNAVNFISGPTLAVIGDKAEFSWSTDLLSLGSLFYKTDVVSGYTEVNTVLAAAHSVELTGLADGNYEYYILASTTPGTHVESAKANFVIAAAPVETSTEETGAEEESTGSADIPAPVSSSGEEINVVVTNQPLYGRLKGKIVLKVEDLGKAYYINPVALTRHYLCRPADAFSVMREQGIGIANANLEKIPIGLTELTGVDTDGDGLSDIFEDAIGTDKAKPDTDNDGFNDKSELLSGYNPKGGDLIVDNKFAALQNGKIFLQVEGNGEAWYINPADSKRYFLGRPADAFAVMRNLGLGISNSDFDAL